MTDRDRIVEQVAHELTGHIGATCCHKTGGRGGQHMHPNCSCREAADAIVSLCFTEAAKVASEPRVGAREWSAATNSGYELAGREIALRLTAIAEEEK